jgi:hypothetical protein
VIFESGSVEWDSEQQNKAEGLTTKDWYDVRPIVSLLDRDYKVCNGSKSGEADKQLLPVLASVRRKFHFDVSKHGLTIRIIPVTL